MDWHHPMARAAPPTKTPQRFVEYTHGLIRELLTNYGKVDGALVHVSCRLTPRVGIRAHDKMVFELQARHHREQSQRTSVISPRLNRRLLPRTNGTRLGILHDPHESWGYHQADDA